MPRLTLTLVPFKGGVTPPLITITNDAFRMTVVPEGEFQTTWSSLPEGYTLKSIESGALDLLKNPLRLIAGVVPDPIIVTLTVAHLHLG